MPDSIKEKKNGSERVLLHSPENLLRNAKRNFFERDDAFKAAYLCSHVIDRFPVTPAADEAKLLLHDITIDNQEKAKRFAEKHCRAVNRTARRPAELNPETNLDIPASTKISLAVAVVALPIIGLAGDGIVGIGVPEAIGLLLMEALFLVASKVRAVLNSCPEKEQFG